MCVCVCVCVGVCVCIGEGGKETLLKSVIKARVETRHSWLCPPHLLQCEDDDGIISASGVGRAHHLHPLNGGGAGGGGGSGMPRTNS